MRLARTLLRTPNRRIAVMAAMVFTLDQLTKYIVLQFLGQGQERVIVDGFFKFVHWGNTGAAWSMFRGNNELLAIVALLALVVLFLARNHFDTRTRLGQLAFGMILGGIAGNLTDRLLPSRHQVIDFIYFYLKRPGGDEIGFPAFNIADSGICIGVALVFWVTWRGESAAKPAETAGSKTPNPE
ncbi:MAG: signal peptidase II [Verrucomicrobiota bacterium]|nr:signal peptidase II [Verrucomicrobiota bacterium]MCC6819330.1 signal peptidase II [Limisphaerales bacterium]